MTTPPAKAHTDLMDEFNEEMNDSWLKILDKENKVDRRVCTVESVP